MCRAVRFSGALFLNHSSLQDPVLALAGRKGDELADIPRLTTNMRADYQWGDRAAGQWNLWASANYVGRSYVGFGPMLDIAQGDFAMFGAGAGWRRGALGVTLTLENLANSHANRFSFGNPFGVAERTQMTPVRPRSIKLTLSRGL